ncbi:aldo/keto reductase family oxidoreductase [Hahella sp. CCB-MM4]|uniref:aldo/keto reductase n=1 Tax=Hahella sp. (strain CCB-MM4) TaxID=1926491 RepID=UPI000B9C20F8|nr:aldo/keto reductase [Hahella sp. CCB-MM4]
MQRIPVCHNGPIFSRFIYGWWRLAEWKMSAADIQQRIEDCLSLGITTHDHADIYGDFACEPLFGQALKQAPHLREKIELVSKCGIQLVSDRRPQHKSKSYNTTKSHIIQSAENSLKEMSTDYLDVLLIHRPDPLMCADEVAEAFSELNTSGKVKYFGVSNFTPRQFDLLQSRLAFPLVTNQVEVSVLHLPPLTDGTLDQAQQLGRCPMAWSSLAGGRLFSDTTTRASHVRTALEEVGNNLGGAHLDQVALSWLLKHPANILPIIGSGSWERIESAVSSAKLQMSREDWYQIYEASAGQELP